MPEPYWIPSEDLFPTSPSSLSHYRSLQPFPVYSSWNGLAVLSPTPFLPPHNVRFRRSDHAPGECAASECGLVAQDFWRVGFGRVQVVPSVQVGDNLTVTMMTELWLKLGYTEKVAKQIRDELANTQSELGWVDGIPPPERDITVEWVKK